MSDTSTSSEVSLYDNYNYENGKPVTTFFPVDLDTKNLDIVNQDGTSGVVIVDETAAASIDPDAIQHEPVVLLVAVSVTVVFSFNVNFINSHSQPWPWPSLAYSASSANDNVYVSAVSFTTPAE